MGIGSRSKAPMGPRTYVGQWLLATMLNQSSERQRLSRMLNGGKSGWNYDEPAVVEVAFQMAVNRFFPKSVDVREVTALVADMRSRIHSTEPPDQLEAEALIRAALGDQDVVISDIQPMGVFNIHVAITAEATRRFELGKDDIERLVLESERIPFERGWNPPLPY